MWGEHCWRTWSSTQGAMALSSVEAEFYAMVDGVQKAIWAGTVGRELGIIANGCRAGDRFERGPEFRVKEGVGPDAPY